MAILDLLKDHGYQECECMIGKNTYIKLVDNRTCAMWSCKGKVDQGK